LLVEEENDDRRQGRRPTQNWRHPLHISPPQQK
jgi:hypothetical protein